MLGLFGRFLAMDAIDKKILAELQRDGRQSITELAERVQLSLSPCHRRVRALEVSGVIEGYHAVINAKKAGLGFEALLFVTISRSDSSTFATVEQQLADIPEVVQAQRLFGEPDYLVKVVTRSLEDYQRLFDERLTGIPGVERLRSTLVMRNVVSDRPLPV